MSYDKPWKEGYDENRKKRKDDKKHKEKLYNAMDILHHNRIINDREYDKLDKRVVKSKYKGGR